MRAARVDPHVLVLKPFLLVCAQPEWIRMFSPDELLLLSSGSTLPVDLADLRGNCVFGGGYSEAHATVQIFW